jgi:hypothetical protein
MSGSPEKKYHPLYNQVGTGIRNFAKAHSDWCIGKYSNMAINPFSLLPVKKIISDKFKYIAPPTDQYPPIRFDNTQLPHYPKINIDCAKFAEWFYNCMTSGKHLTTYDITEEDGIFEEEWYSSEEDDELFEYESIDEFVVPDDYIEYEDD